MSHLCFSADGAPGRNTPDAAHGRDAKNRRGRDGEPGESVSMPGTPGQDGGSITVHLSTLKDSGNFNNEAFQVGVCISTGGREQENCVVDNRSPTQDTTIVLSAIGGMGGNGGRGGNGGIGATGRSGVGDGNGGRGGSGGDAGSGSSGGSGGHGGTIEIHVSKDDTYLLMAIADARDPSCRVKGGAGGKKGHHGIPGLGGAGGPGGRGRIKRDPNGHTGVRSKGGISGPRGSKGKHAIGKLSNGKDGRNGVFSMCVKDGDAIQKYHQRYDLKLSFGLTACSDEALGLNTFQFGDTVSLLGIGSKNVGPMECPAHPAEVRIQKSATITPLASNTCFFDTKIGLGPGATRSAEGPLDYYVPTPNLQHLGSDFEPHVARTKLFLEAHQLGPNGFSREYQDFDESGAEMEFRFPVENTSGFEGLHSIPCGSATRIKFALRNASVRALGAKSVGGRKLFVQFYHNPSLQYDIATSDYRLTVEGVECERLSENMDQTLFRGNLFPIELLEGGSSVELTGSLWVSPQAAPYGRVAIQAEILLGDLPSSNQDRPDISLIQRRQLEVVTEPVYHQSKRNHAVLVSSDATSKAEFDAWKELLTKRLGLSVGFFSVSINGSLRPDHRLPSGDTLAEAFKNKLIVLLDQAFNPLHEGVSSLCPSEMLPNGCMSQASGFDESTRWLLIGSPDEAIKKTMHAHFTAPPTDSGKFDSVKEFFAVQKERLEWERSSGVVKDTEIRQDVIVIFGPRGMDLGRARIAAFRNLKAKAKEVARWLRKWDPLRQYTVEWRADPSTVDKQTTYGEVVVRRGYCRTTNSVFVMPRRTESRDRIVGGCTVLATAMSIPGVTLLDIFHDAVNSNSSLVEICLDAVVQGLLWDLANFVDGRLLITDAFNQCFPTLQMLSENEKLLALAKADTAEASFAMSSLVARLECVAESKDLRPWWSPWSQRFATQRELKVRVEQLRKTWGSAVKQEVVDKEKCAIVDQVQKFLSQKSCIPSPRYADRWRKGLMHVCSFRNDSRPDYSWNKDGVYRLIEFDHSDYDKTLRPRSPSKQVKSWNACNEMRDVSAKQQLLSSVLLQSIQETRALQESSVEPEVKVM